MTKFPILRIGQTSLVKVIDFESASILIKLEGENPTGSIKDRACVSLIQHKIHSGELEPGAELLDASSGNMACSIAYFGRLLGFMTTVVVSSKLTESKREFLKIYGANVISLGSFTIEGNQHCRNMINSKPHLKYCFLDQLHNWANPKGYYDTLAPELIVDCSNISALVGSLGSGGSLYGTGSFLKERLPNIMIIPVQATHGTRLPGVGSFDDGDYITPFIFQGFKESLFTDPVKVSMQDALKWTAFLRDQGIFCGLSTGAAFSASIMAVKRFKLVGNVVVLSGDSGWKNMDQLINLDPLPQNRNLLDHDC